MQAKACSASTSELLPDDPRDVAGLRAFGKPGHVVEAEVGLDQRGDHQHGRAAARRRSRRRPAARSAAPARDPAASAAGSSGCGGHREQGRTGWRPSLPNRLGACHMRPGRARDVAANRSPFHRPLGPSGLLLGRLLACSCASSRRARLLGSAARASARRAACGSGAARGRRRGPPPRRGGRGRGACRASRRARRCRPRGRPSSSAAPGRCRGAGRRARRRGPRPR